MPERLLGLYAALGNDSFLGKECLARPALVDRLTHNFYAFDRLIHANERAQATSLYAQLSSGVLTSSTENPNRTVCEYVVDADRTSDRNSAPSGVLRYSVSSPEFQQRRLQYPGNVGQVSDLAENKTSFAFSVVLSETAGSFRVARYVIEKTAWDSW